MKQKYFKKKDILKQAILAVGLVGFGLHLEVNAQHLPLSHERFKELTKEATLLSGSVERSQEYTTENTISPYSISTTKSLPQKSMDYDPNGNEWTHVHNSAYTYNNLGYQTSRTNTLPTGEKVSRRISNYDNQGNWTSRIDQDWSGSEWIIKFGDSITYTYNTASLVTQEIHKSHSNGVWENSYKIDYILDSSGRVIEQIESEWLNGNWTSDYKVLYTYIDPNANYSKLVNQDFVDGTWVNNYQYIDVTYQNNNILSYKNQDWVNNSWVDDSRYNITYDANGGFVDIMESYINGAWVNDRRTTLVIDSHGNFTDYKSEDWLNSSWIIQFQYQVAITYNTNNDITERSAKKWDSQTSSLKNFVRYVYSDFLYVTGIKSSLAKMAVNVYPNPTKSTMVIEADINSTTQLQLTDLTGKSVLTKSFATGSASTQELDLSSLPAGMYILNMKNSKASFTSRVVKQ